MPNIRILIIYTHFLPSFKSGGPIQSIANLVRQLHGVAEFYVLTQNKELGETGTLRGVTSNRWLDFEEGKAKVFYIGPDRYTPTEVWKCIKEIQPHLILLNGIYSFAFSVLPAIIYPRRVIMHPRGMLHLSALGKKSFKKSLWLKGMQILKLPNRISFMASDALEAQYIQQAFGKKVKVAIAQNFPSFLEAQPAIKKEVGKVTFVTIALIGEMKNHLLVIQALKKVQSEVIWDIFGPIKNQQYWQQCLQELKDIPKNIQINYRGEIKPNEVQVILANSHFFLMPSQSENFGHALVEAMSSGRPIITSKNTPWNSLESHNAGFNVDLNPESIAEVIHKVAELNQTAYNKMVQAVRLYAEERIDLDQIKKQYLQLFKLPVLES